MKRYTVLEKLRDRNTGRLIRPGDDWQPPDEATAERLVKAGCLEEAGNAAPPPPPPQGNTTPPTSAGKLTEFNAAQLKERAQKAGIEGATRMKKADLIAALKAHQPGAAE